MIAHADYAKPPPAARAGRWSRFVPVLHDAFWGMLRLHDNRFEAVCGLRGLLSVSRQSSSESPCPDHTLGTRTDRSKKVDVGSDERELNAAWNHEPRCLVDGGRECIPTTFHKESACQRRGMACKDEQLADRGAIGLPRPKQPFNLGFAPLFVSVHRWGATSRNWAIIRHVSPSGVSQLSLRLFGPRKQRHCRNPI